MIDREQRTAIMEWQREFRKRPGVSTALKAAQYIVLALVVAWLIYRFSKVGWGEVIGALPTSAWFYLFFTLRFVALPLSEMLIYQLIWGVSLNRHFAVFLRKRVYNFAVMGYSGEGFLTLWARRNLDLPDKDIIVGVKDNNLLSALASNLATVFILIGLVLAGGLRAGLDALPPGGGLLFLAAFASALTLSVTVIVLRNRLIALPVQKLRPIMGIHGIRTVLILVLHVAMYAAALPGAPLSAWAMFLALQLVISRIPFIPNQDLVFLGAALSLTPLVQSTEAELAGMLLAEAGLSQFVNLVLFVGTAWLARQNTTSCKFD